jgi:hypothetical protein
MTEERQPFAGWDTGEAVGVDEAPFFEVDLPPVTMKDKLDLYEIYREMGGDAFEPNESQLQANRMGSAGAETREAA